MRFLIVIKKPENWGTTLLNRFYLKKCFCQLSQLVVDYQLITMKDLLNKIRLDKQKYYLGAILYSK